MPESDKRSFAKLVDQQKITPTISRFRFQIIDEEKLRRWMPGQYVALSFSNELDSGYSHMRDDDPKSLNDDYLRTFTVSSPPGEQAGIDHFEITIRKVGRATAHLFMHDSRTYLELPIKGFGGEFFVQQSDGEYVSFIAGGIGITPLLAQASTLNLKWLKLFWTIRADDLGLVLDAFERVPELRASTTLFVTGSPTPESRDQVGNLETANVTIFERRLTAEDLPLENTGTPISKWYICTGPILRVTLLEWLKDRTVIYEDFNF